MWAARDHALWLGVDLGHPALDPIGITLVINSAVERIGEVDAASIATDFDHLRPTFKRPIAPWSSGPCRNNPSPLRGHGILVSSSTSLSLCECNLLGAVLGSTKTSFWFSPKVTGHIRYDCKAATRLPIPIVSREIEGLPSHSHRLLTFGWVPVADLTWHACPERSSPQVAEPIKRAVVRSGILLSACCRQRALQRKSCRTPDHMHGSL
jgi:hypothetical protein